jgi:single-strand DNA-binding protein
MINMNKVLLGGNLTKDPQMRSMPDGTPVVDFRMAINRKYTTKDGQKKEEVCYIDCSAFSKQATTIGQYFEKGKPIFVEGRLIFDTWKAQDGTNRSRHKVRVSHFFFVDPAPKSNEETEAVAQYGSDGDFDGLEG